MVFLFLLLYECEFLGFGLKAGKSMRCDFFFFFIKINSIKIKRETNKREQYDPWLSHHSADDRIDKKHVGKR